ncbi:uncharacterized protein LOC127279590 [Leptopilina boulardi]|uniref:uncharacterized protein LOC127279590 n=1 Tax=Leptopilina boulardi TaxID=63433 RepID=UPI0021F6865A|nr:uncharacterized protein LOC127279590 [Leptopilina boulardi]
MTLMRSMVLVMQAIPLMLLQYSSEFKDKASVPPADLLALEREEIILLLKEANSSEEEDRPSKDRIRFEARHRLVEKWQERWDGEVKGRWTYRLIPTLATWLIRNHGKVSYYLTKALTGHGCFNSYLQRFKKRESEVCAYCQFPVDSAEHTLSSRWDLEKQAMFIGVNAIVTPENMVALMIQSQENWRLIETFIISVMMRKDLDDRR